MRFWVLLVVACSISTAQAGIKGTAILFRHGERSAIVTNGTDFSENVKDGQLTKVGSRQLYENGVLLRLKYGHLFPRDGFFSLDNMKIMTSVPTRTMMSLQSFMAGFFPPPLLDTNLPVYWQPFFTTVDHKAEFIYMDIKTCPRYAKEFFEVSLNPPANVLQWLVEDREILEQLSIWSSTELNSALDVYTFAHWLKAVLILDKTVPKWVVEAYENVLVKYAIKGMSNVHANPIMIKIRGGPLITQIINNFEALWNRSSDSAPIMIYSAHDSTLQSMAYVLGVEDQIPGIPSYSDTFMVDLSDEGNVSVVYLDTKTFPKTRIVVDVPGCGISCSLATFRQAMSHQIVTDLDALCAV